MSEERKEHRSADSGSSGHESPEEIIRALGDPELDPYEIEFSERYKNEQRGPRGAFINSHGVVIGDHEYASPQSPLENWSKETDPFVMAGDEWVHPFKDVGFRTAENRDIFEKDLPPQGGIFMHPTLDAAHRSVLESEAEDKQRLKEGKIDRPDDPKA